jgi:hypothetical protein
MTSSASVSPLITNDFRLTSLARDLIRPSASRRGEVVEEVVGDGVARLGRGLRAHGVVGDHLIVEELVGGDLGVDGVARALADVVEDAACAEHDG